MKEMSLFSVFKTARWWCQKNILFLIIALIFSVNVIGILWHIKIDFDADLIFLKNQTEMYQTKIKQAIQDRKNDLRKRRLYEQAKQEGFDRPALSASQIHRLVMELSKKYHLSDIHVKREKAQREYSLPGDSYALFLSSKLDVDVFKFIAALSHGVKGILDVTLFSLFRENDGLLKGEIRFEIITSPKEKGVSS